MAMQEARSGAVSGRNLALAALGYAGGTMSITLLFLGMRTVMDVGGYCAEGGAYVIQTHCPDAAAPSMFIGMIGIFLFGFIASVYGGRVGGIWAAAPVLGWAALFGALGWNFMEYGLFAPPSGSVEIGWLICGVVFWIMAAVPLAGLVALRRAGLAVGSVPVTRTTTLRGPGQPARTVDSSPPARPASAAPATGAAERAALAGIAGAFEAAVERAEAETPADPSARASAVAAGAGGEDAPPSEFQEGTQALLDRLERLADMRDRGLLDAAEYETAKEAVMRELEARS